MSKAGKLRRRSAEIRERNMRREKIRKLKLRYKNAKTEGDRKAVLEKIWKMSPHYPLQELTGKAA